MDRPVLFTPDKVDSLLDSAEIMSEISNSLKVPEPIRQMIVFQGGCLFRLALTLGGQYARQAILDRTDQTAEQLDTFLKTAEAFVEARYTTKGWQDHD